MCESRRCVQRYDERCARGRTEIHTHTPTNTHTHVIGEHIMMDVCVGGWIVGCVAHTETRQLERGEYTENEHPHNHWSYIEDRKERKKEISQPIVMQNKNMWCIFCIYTHNMANFFSHHPSLNLSLNRFLFANKLNKIHHNIQPTTRGTHETTLNWCIQFVLADDVYDRMFVGYCWPFLTHTHTGTTETTASDPPDSDWDSFFLGAWAACFRLGVCVCVCVIVSIVFHLKNRGRGLDGAFK